MKLKKIVITTALCAVTAPCLTSCIKKQEVGGANVIQIKAYDGGYGIEWLTELINQFNITFKDQNISARLEEHNEGVTTKSKQEMLDIEGNQTDLYFTNGSDVTSLLQQNIKGFNGKVFEQLDDVLESKAIGSDGNEESKTIKERFFKGYEEACQYNGYQERIKGNLYKLPWAGAMCGLFANKEVLNKYSIDLPLTSKELTSAIESIYTHTESDKVYPYAFGGNNAPGYWAFLYETWFGQYSGQDKFIKFMKCEPESGTIKDKGYKVYEDIGIKKSLEGMFDILNLKYAPSGSASMEHTSAQSKFVTGDAAFIVCGDWIMNEMKELYGNKQNSIVMLQTPILSSIGTDNGLSTDTELHDVVAGVDSGKTNSEIQDDVPAATDDLINKVRDARKVVDTIGPTHDMFIPSYSDSKDAAKKFIRFMYSNDGCNIFRKHALANLPLEYEVNQENKNNSTEYMKSLDKIYGQNPTVISGSADYNQVRDQADILIFNETSWVHPTTYTTIMTDKFSGQNKLSAATIYSEEATFVSTKWSDWMKHVTF